MPASSVSTQYPVDLICSGFRPPIPVERIRRMPQFFAEFREWFIKVNSLGDRGAVRPSFVFIDHQFTDKQGINSAPEFCTGVRVGDGRYIMDGF